MGRRAGWWDSGKEESAWPLLCLLRELLGDPQAWPLLLASCLVPGVLQLASLPLLPESPRYLLIDCGDTEACLAGESLSLGSQTALTKGCISSEYMGPHFIGSFIKEKLSLSLCLSFMICPYLPSVRTLIKWLSKLPGSKMDQT